MAEIVWRRSERCGTSACVEVARQDGKFLVRDSADPDGGRLAFDAGAWAAFVTEIRGGGLRPESE